MKRWRSVFHNAFIFAGVCLLAGRFALADSYMITTFTGVKEAGLGALDGRGKGSRFHFPSGAVIDKDGNVYVADSGNQTIRKITADGMAMTVAGLAGSPGSADGTGAKARFQNPLSLAMDAEGNMYVTDTDNHLIRKIAAGGKVSTIAGLATVAGSEDGMGRVARFASPSGIVSDAAGSLYITDTENHTIRKISAEGLVTTFAGAAGQRGSVNGTGSAARFHFPQGLGLDTSGNIYVADTYNHVIRKITPSGIVTTLAGTAGVSGSTDGNGSAARFNQPCAVTIDGGGVLYVADSGNSTIRRIIGETVFTLAGSAGVFASKDEAGAAARFNYPLGIASDGKGRIYVADTYNHTIRTISRGSSVQTIAGVPPLIGNVDGASTNAQFNFPNGIGADESGNIYVADSGNHVIRKISNNGVVITLAGLAGSTGTVDQAGSAARFNFPVSLDVDSAGTIYVADSQNHAIRKVTSDGLVSTLAGLPGTAGTSDGTGSSARFSAPAGVTVDSQGTVYVADTWNHTIRSISSAGVVVTIAGRAGENGSRDGTVVEARFTFPEGIGLDRDGNLYIADNGTHTVRRITSGGIVSTLAGSALASGTEDGLGSAARFNLPFGLAVDDGGNVFVSDTANRTIRKITPAGLVSTIGGMPRIVGAADGIGTFSRFSAPAGLVIRGGDLYIADAGNHNIRKAYLAPADSPTSAPAAAGVGTRRELDVSNPSMDSWAWSFARYPATSQATMENPGARNPTFTPDVDDLFIVRMEGANSNGKQTTRFLSVESDAEPPTLTVVTPSPNDYSQGLLSLQGTASDNIKVAGVWWQLNGSEWRPASTVNGWTNWNANLSLQPGTNQIRAYARDEAGNNSLTNAISVISEAAFILRLGASRPQLGGIVDLSLDVLAGVAGQLQLSDDLRTWNHIADFTGTGTTLQFQDSTVTNYSKRFYRAIIP